MSSRARASERGRVCTPVSQGSRQVGAGLLGPKKGTRNVFRGLGLSSFIPCLKRCPGRRSLREGPPGRGCCRSPGGVRMGLPEEGFPDASGCAVGGQPRVLYPGTSSAPGWASSLRDGPPCQALSCSPSGWPWACWLLEGTAAHGQSTSLCPGFVSDFTLSEGLHVSCVRLSGDESPRAGPPRSPPTSLASTASSPYTGPRL